VLAAGALREGRWLPRATVVLSAAFGLAFGLSNPDARIAEHNVARYERGGPLDRDYLEGLSPDATPVLLRAGITPVRLADEDGLAGANLGRARARAALKRG
jgi:hypothetical protein